MMPAPRVLVCDDVRALRRLVAFQLEGTGCEIVGEAEDGLQAVAMGQQLDPDVILMDLQMPRLDGLEAINHLRAGGYDAGIVVFSAFPEQLGAAHTADADAYLEKGCHPEELARAVLLAAEWRRGTCRA